MGRLVILLAIVAVVGLLAARYRAARVRDEERGARDLPSLPDDLAGGATWLVLSTPVCATCVPVTERLSAAYPDEVVVRLDVTERPELAERYELRRAPTVLRAEPDGTVTERLVGAEAVAAHLDGQQPAGRAA